MYFGSLSFLRDVSDYTGDQFSRGTIEDMDIVKLRTRRFNSCRTMYVVNEHMVYLFEANGQIQVTFEQVCYNTDCVLDHVRITEVLEVFEDNICNDERL